VPDFSFDEASTTKKQNARLNPMNLFLPIQPLIRLQAIQVKMKNESIMVFLLDDKTNITGDSMQMDLLQCREPEFLQLHQG
jgi:hypothetical protein